MKSFFWCWLQTQKKLKNFMRIGSSKASAASALHCLTENKHNKVFFISQDDDAFSIVIVDGTRGWNSSSECENMKLWRRFIHLWPSWMCLGMIMGLKSGWASSRALSWAFKCPRENESENLKSQKWPNLSWSWCFAVGSSHSWRRRCEFLNPAKLEQLHEVVRTTILW